VRRQLLAVVRRHVLQARDLVRLELLTGSELVRGGRAEDRVAARPAPAVLVHGRLRLLLVLGLARRHDLRALHREGHVVDDAGLDVGLGEEGVEVGHVVSAPCNARYEPGGSISALRRRPIRRRSARCRAQSPIRGQGADLRNDAARHEQAGSPSADRVSGPDDQAT